MKLSKFIQHVGIIAKDDDYEVYAYNPHTNQEEKLTELDVDVDMKNKRIVIDHADLGILP